MTFLTSSHAVSIFPRETFVNRRVYACRKLQRSEKDITWDWVNGYFGKTCTFIGAPLMRLVTVLPREVSTSARCIGDSRSWVIKFDKGMYKEMTL